MHVRARVAAVHHDCNGLIRRFATCLYYLTDVEEGGETIFPAASDARTDFAHLRTVDEAIGAFLAPEHRALDTSLPRATERARDGRAQRGGGGVVCKPTKGDAIIWYN